MDASIAHATRPDQVVYLSLPMVFDLSAGQERLLSARADAAEALSSALSGWPDARIVLISTQASSKGLPAGLRELGPLASRKVGCTFDDLAVKVPFGRINPLMKAEAYARLDRMAVVLCHLDWLKPRCWVVVDDGHACWPKDIARQHLVLADGAQELLAPATLDRLLTVLVGNFGLPVTSAVDPAQAAAEEERIAQRLAEELPKLEAVTVHHTPLGIGYILMADLEETARRECQRYAGKRRGLLRLPTGEDAVFLGDYRLWIESLKGNQPEL